MTTRWVGKAPFIPCRPPAEIGKIDTRSMTPIGYASVVTACVHVPRCTMEVWFEHVYLNGMCLVSVPRRLTRSRWRSCRPSLRPTTRWALN
jgi:hypothetical protein